MEKYLESNLTPGKIISLFIRGCYRYGLSEIAYRMLTGCSGTDGQGNHVSWLKVIMDERGSATTIECQTYKENEKPNGYWWYDRSHPDTAVAHLLTGFILGVQPAEPGFRDFIVEPHMFGVKRCEGIIPTPFGDIYCSCETGEKGLKIEVNHPEGTSPHIILEDHAETDTVIINGKPWNRTAAKNPFASRTVSSKLKVTANFVR